MFPERHRHKAVERFPLGIGEQCALERRPPPQSDAEKISQRHRHRGFIGSIPVHFYIDGTKGSRASFNNGHPYTVYDTGPFVVHDHFPLAGLLSIPRHGLLRPCFSMPPFPFAPGRFSRLIHRVSAPAGSSYNCCATAATGNRQQDRTRRHA